MNNCIICNERTSKTNRQCGYCAIAKKQGRANVAERSRKARAYLTAWQERKRAQQQGWWQRLLQWTKQ
jgi:ribosomal protein L34